MDSSNKKIQIKQTKTRRSKTLRLKSQQSKARTQRQRKNSTILGKSAKSMTRKDINFGEMDSKFSRISSGSPKTKKGYGINKLKRKNKKKRRKIKTKKRSKIKKKRKIKIKN